jgi:hypothetical protein
MMANSNWLRIPGRIYTPLSVGDAFRMVWKYIGR